MSVSSSPCVVPGRTPSFTLPDGKVELGLGIHGEAGFNQIGMQPVDTIVVRRRNFFVNFIYLFFLGREEGERGKGCSGVRDVMPVVLTSREERHLCVFFSSVTCCRSCGSVSPRFCFEQVCVRAVHACGRAFVRAVRA